MVLNVEGRYRHNEENRIKGKKLLYQNRKNALAKLDEHKKHK